LMQLMLCCWPSEICFSLKDNVDFKKHKIRNIKLADSETYNSVLLCIMEDALFMLKVVEKALKDW